jgi:flagellar FliJ protein
MTQPFRLGQVLDHARMKEDAQAVQLSTLDAECRRSRHALDQLREQEAAQLSALAEATRAGALDPAATEAARHYLARLEQAIAEQIAHVAAVEARVEESRQELLAIAREKRLLERLEERHDETVAADAARRENARTDELSTQRHLRQQRNGRGVVA